VIAITGWLFRGLLCLSMDESCGAEEKFCVLNQMIEFLTGNKLSKGGWRYILLSLGRNKAVSLKFIEDPCASFSHHPVMSAKF
jgi:hypothetical protein